MRKRIRLMKTASKPSWWSLEEGKHRYLKTVWIPQKRKKAVILHDELPF